MVMTSCFVTGTIAPLLGITNNASCHLLHKCQIIPSSVLIVSHRDQVVIPELLMVITCLPPKILVPAPMLPLLPFQIARQARTVTAHVQILIHRSPLMCLP